MQKPLKMDLADFTREPQQLANLSSSERNLVRSHAWLVALTVTQYI